MCQLRGKYDVRQCSAIHNFFCGFHNASSSSTTHPVVSYNTFLFFVVVVIAIAIINLTILLTVEEYFLFCGQLQHTVSENTAPHCYCRRHVNVDVLYIFLSSLLIIVIVIFSNNLCTSSGRPYVSLSNPFRRCL